MGGAISWLRARLGMTTDDDALRRGADEEQGNHSLEAAVSELAERIRSLEDDLRNVATFLENLQCDNDLRFQKVHLEIDTLKQNDFETAELVPPP